MKILHLYPKQNDMIASHVSILTEGMRHSAEVQTADSYTLFKARFLEMQPDVVHFHGCTAINKAVSTAYKHKTRIVISPHGQLEPWMLKSSYGKTDLLLRRSVERAYAIITFGKMERQYLEQLGWNSRIEVIHNAIITNSISPEEMVSQTFAVYQKITDSNVLEQMNDNSKRLMAIIIKPASRVIADGLQRISSRTKPIGDASSYMPTTRISATTWITASISWG